MAGGISGGKDKGSQTSTNRVDVPDWLMPFMRQGLGAATNALSRIGGMVNQDLFEDLTPDQLEALDRMRGIAGSEFTGTAQDAFLRAASGGSGVDPELAARLSGAGFDMGDSITGIADTLGFTQSPEAREALESTARGDYLFGGEGFDAAVDAAVRAATPQIMSVFGGDASSVDSGLSRTAVGKAAIDAFAGQYGDRMRERLGAAEALESGGRADRGQYLSFADSEANRARRGDELLAAMGEGEEARRLGAAGRLPGIGMLDANILMDAGNIAQRQGQGEIDARMQGLLQYLQAAMGAPAYASPFLGGTQTGSYQSTNIGFEGFEPSMPGKG